MRLTMRNIGIFSHKEIEIPEANLVIYEDVSAAGKTTVAKTLATFLTKEVPLSLLKSGATHGEASLYFRGRTYRLEISGNADVEAVWKNTDIGKMIVLVEGSQVFNFAFTNISTLDLNNIMNSVPVLRLPRMPRKPAPVESLRRMLEEHERRMKSYQKELEIITKEIEKLKQTKKETAGSIDVTPIIEYNNILKRIETLKDEAKELERKLATIPTYDGNTVTKLMEEKAKIEDEKRSLDWRIGALKEIINGMKSIVSGLRKLEQYSDIIDEMNLVIAGGFLTSDIIRSMLDDMNVNIESVTSELETLEKQSKLLLARITELNSRIMDAKKVVEEYQEITSRLEKVRTELQNLLARRDYLKSKVEELEKKYGMSAAEIMELKVQEDEAVRKSAEIERKISALLRRKSEIEGEMSSLRITINSIKEKLRMTNVEAEEYEKYVKVRKEIEAKRRKFADVFMKTFMSAFETITIPDFDFRKIRAKRPMGTYSHSERMLIGVALLTATAKALEAIGIDVPYVVVDVVAPLDPRYMSVIKQLLKSIKAPAIMLQTSPSPSIKVEN